MFVLLYTFFVFVLVLVIRVIVVSSAYQFRSFLPSWTPIIVAFICNIELVIYKVIIIYIRQST